MKFGICNDGNTAEYETYNDAEHERKTHWKDYEIRELKTRRLDLKHYGIRNKETKAWMFSCEGLIHWFPSRTIAQAQFDCEPHKDLEIAEFPEDEE